jgi:superfamily I DNA and/or RNA helicase
MCEEESGSQFEVLTIKTDKENCRLVDRLLKSDIKQLIDSDISGIQKVLDCGRFDDDDTKVYIKYEYFNHSQLEKDNSNSKLSTFRDILTTLHNLKKENRSVQVISPDNILVDDAGNAKLAFVGLFELFKQQRLLDKEYLSPNVIIFLEPNEKDQPRPNYQDDIYSAVKTFEPFLKSLSDVNADKILEKALAPIRQERFTNYLDILELVDKIDYTPTFDKTLKIGMHPDNREAFQPIFEEMNKKCYMMIEPELAKNEKRDITGLFSTNNWHGRFFVPREMDDCIRIGNPQEGAHGKFDTLSGDWFLADFSFSFDDFSTNFVSFGFFEEKFNKQCRLTALNKTKQGAVNKWQTLPEKEKEYIEENAFRAKYDEFKIRRGKGDVDFFLVDNKYDWEKVKTLKSEKTTLYSNDIKIGKIGDYRPKDNVIIIRDTFCDEQEIPQKSELYEDVRQKVSQYKKQIEACQKIVKRDIVNPDLCSILATPDAAPMPHDKKIWDVEYEKFKEKVFNQKLKTDDTQSEAVLEALSYKPMYLIQGPPGTGKTTVIVELTRQIIAHKNDAKILITSQSNLAVDNVLERIEEINQKEKQKLLFMRLASESEDKDINVVDAIKPHTYERKLKSWIDDTIKKSEESFNRRFPELQSNKGLLFLIEFYYEIDFNGSFVEFKKKLDNSQRGNFIKNLFEHAKNIDEVKNVFEKKLGGDILKLKKIQKDWFVFLNNATSDKNKSMLNYGSAQTDFLTAMMMQTNIIGATCIHIASSKYSKVDFKFDYVIMDESSKASPAETLVPLNMGKNIVLIGDHRQLPPVITREDAVKQKVKEKLEDNGLDVEKEFGESLFEKLIKVFEEDEEKQKYLKMLDIQYRMPRQIGSLISKHFYDGKLKNPCLNVVPDFDKDKCHGLIPLKSGLHTSIVFISSSKHEKHNDNGNKYNRQNHCNAQIIKKTLQKLDMLYNNNLQEKTPFTIGVIAGYRGQVELLKRTIDLSQYKSFIKIDTNGNKKDLIKINTVDQFQGAEEDIIIYDVVRSDRGNANIGFLDDYRRINVAFSRAKRLLIIVGDSEYLIKRATLNPGGKFKEFKLRQIAEDLQEQGLIFNSLEEVF